ncbi:MAG: AAA family ATPase [Dethiosulfatibacter sp.]|nr:AAA family ATPase [Dethiosulfatibacter sp.]
MIFKNITLYNFRQFKGEYKIEFSMHADKNVTLLLGVNTSGKTTIIQAFHWCLYGTSSFRNSELINVEVKKAIGLNSMQEVYVEITLIHEDREYIIKRTQNFKKNEIGRVSSVKPELIVQYKEKTGGMQSIPKARGTNINEDSLMNETINKILPKSLSDYFFFDGERITDINNRGDVVAAVRGLMGLDVISSAMDRLDPSKASSVTSEMRNELDLGMDTRSTNLKSNLEEEKRKLEGYRVRKDEIKNEIEYFERRKVELNNTLLANKEVKEKQNHKLDLEKDIAVLERTIESEEKRLRTDWSKGAMSFFSKPLVLTALNIIEESKQDHEGIPEMRAKAIDFIMNRGYCICGCDLVKNEGAKESILREKSFLPPQHMGTILRNYKQTYKRFYKEADDFNDLIKDSYTNYRTNSNLYEDKKEALVNISKQIQGVLNIEKIEQDYQKNERDLKSKRDIEKKIHESIGATENTIKNLETKINGLAIVSNRNQKIMKATAYSIAIYEWFKTSYDKQEKEVKRLLLDSVNKIFEQMYHGRRLVSINDKYQIELITMVGDEKMSTDESKGLESVKNFSFISGLVDLARRKARTGTLCEPYDSCVDSEGELNVNTEPYPLVMDAPFSNVDEIHINNIARIIPEVAEQVILLVMKKDWDVAKEALEDRIGCSYIIEKFNNSDTSSLIRRYE